MRHLTARLNVRSVLLALLAMGWGIGLVIACQQGDKTPEPYYPKELGVEKNTPVHIQNVAKKPGTARIVGTPTPVPRLIKTGALPTPTILPCEYWDQSWHQGPLNGGWVIAFNDQDDQIVVRECKYEGPQLTCYDWIKIRQEHWRWLKREVSRTKGW